MSPTRRFHLERDQDLTGTSGVGQVADGCEFADGACVLRWNTQHTSTAVYASIEAVIAIHGHDGRTRVIYDD